LSGAIDLATSGDLAPSRAILWAGAEAGLAAAERLLAAAVA